jgi:hypothetical protein
VQQEGDWCRGQRGKLVVAADKASMNALVHPFLTKQDYRWVVTDYDGLGQLETSGFAPFAFQDASLALRRSGGGGGGGGAGPSDDDDMVDRYSHHCQVIVLDAMGTAPEKVTSHRNYTRTNFFTGFRYLDNDLQQGTGFLAATNFARPWRMPRGRRRKQVLVWGKFHTYFTSAPSTQSAGNNVALFRALSAHFTDGVVVAMSSEEFAQMPKDLLPYITRNAGSMRRPEFLALLRSSLALLGVGEPLDALSALEALALQTVFLNPRLLPAKSTGSMSTSTRPFTAQHVYVEQRIPPPLAYTLDIHDMALLNATLVDLDLHAHEELPMLPPEFYARGYVHNLAQNLRTVERTCDPRRDTVLVHPATVDSGARNNGHNWPRSMERRGRSDRERGRGGMRALAAQQPIRLFSFGPLLRRMF